MVINKNERVRKWIIFPLRFAICAKTKRENIVSARTAEGLAPEKNAKLHNKTNTKTPLRLLPIGTLFKGLIKRENKSAKNTQMQSRDGLIMNHTSIGIGFFYWFINCIPITSISVWIICLLCVLNLLFKILFKTKTFPFKNVFWSDFNGPFLAFSGIVSHRENW